MESLNLKIIWAEIKKSKVTIGIYKDIIDSFSMINNNKILKDLKWNYTV